MKTSQILAPEKAFWRTQLSVEELARFGVKTHREGKRGGRRKARNEGQKGLKKCPQFYDRGEVIGRKHSDSLLLQCLGE